MAEQTIYRRRRRRPFTQIDNTPLRDDRLSLEAVGFLVVVLSLPDDWEINRTWAMKRFKLGKDKLRRVIDELKRCGYCVHYQDRDKHQRLGASVYVFSDEANCFDEPDVEPLAENPPADPKPLAVKPLTENPPTYKRNSKTNKINNKKPAKPAADKPAKSTPAPTIHKSSAQHDPRQIKPKQLSEQHRQRMKRGFQDLLANLRGQNPANLQLATTESN